MRIHVTESDHYVADEPRGTGCLTTDRGNLPLHKLDVRARITGLVGRTELVQGFRNPYDTALEATYIFALPDRAALTSMTMTAEGRTVVAELQERAAARQSYDDAIAAGHRASIAEEDRPDVFTMRVGNIEPGERVEISLVLLGPLPFEDGEATFRFPLVVAPRYIPGAALPDPQAGDGWAPDTDSTPDASRITPPVLLPGFPNPIDLSIEVAVDPSGLPLGDIRSSLHVITGTGDTIRVRPGERVDRDFVLRLPYGDAAMPSTALVATSDDDTADGTFQLTVVPPRPAHGTRGKDIVLLLDRSGSMQGWKMVAARRSAARIVDTLGNADRFAVLTFDNVIEWPQDLPAGLVAATDRHRFRAVEHLSRADARGGTDLLGPLETGLRLLGATGTDRTAGTDRDRVLVLITDGQVGNEDQLLRATSQLCKGIRVHTVGIDQAVNAGFLGRLASAGGGRCELVESEDRLDAAMSAIHRRIAAPLVTDLRLVGDGLIEGTVSPARLPDLFSGVPLVIRGRYRGAAPMLTLSGSRGAAEDWHITARPMPTPDQTVTKLWARAALRDLEDAFVTAPSDVLEQQIVTTSLRFGVLCRFTAFVAVDSRRVSEGGRVHRVIQPVELPAGWARPSAPFAHPSGATFHLQSAAPMAAEVGVARVASAAGQAFAKSGGARRAQRDAPTGLDAARAQAADEARALEQQIAAEEWQRLVMLDDLARRLDALADRLDHDGFDSSELRSIVAVLRDDTISTDERWDRARAALTEFAEPGTSARAPFWKRR